MGSFRALIFGITKFLSVSEPSLQTAVAVTRDSTTAMQVTPEFPLRILIADDDQFSMAISKHVLGMTFKQLYLKTTMNGQEVIDALKEEPFDIILLDLNMPVMNGFEATIIIRNNFEAPLNLISIVALTGSDQDEDIQRAKLAGMNDYIVKPFKPGDLIAKVRANTARIF